MRTDERRGVGAGGGGAIVRVKASGAELLTDWLRLEGARRAARSFSFTVDGRHLHLAGRLWFQANDGDGGHVCWRRTR